MRPLRIFDFRHRFSYGQRSKCADLQNSHNFRLIVQQFCTLTALTALSIFCS